MSRDESASEKARRVYLNYKVAIALALLIVLPILFLAALASPRSPATGRSGTPPGERQPEDSLVAAREALLKSGDAAACDGALQLVNAHLARQSVPNPVLDPKVKELIGPDPSEAAELESATFTPLDARYLEECLLLRDAAWALGVTGDAAHRGKVAALDRAASAFAWVTRQVVLVGVNEETVPPAYLLRRGEGDATERALAFLALLSQLNAPGDDANALRGCLVLLPDQGGKSANLWACGIAVGAGTELYLFDPRAGLPLPGPGGKGVATLADAARNPVVLAQLDAPGGPAYDVKSEQAKAAQLWCVPSLSSLAPRMQNLERLLGPGLAVRLSADLSGDVDRLTRAARAAVPNAEVIVWKPGVRLLRRFLPQDVGGTPVDKSSRGIPRLRSFEDSLVPWASMPRQLMQLPQNHDIGRRVFLNFARPFQDGVLKPGGARDLMLRGRYTPAVEELLTEQGNLRSYQQARAGYPELAAKVADWYNNTAVPAYAQFQRAKSAGDPAAVAEAQSEIDTVWKQRAEPVFVLMQAAVADKRLERVTFLIALCLHEKAFQLQTRLEQSGGDSRPSEREKARDAWGEARSWWERYMGEFPDGADTAAARRLRGEAEAALGNWKAAADAWSTPAARTTGVPQRLADLYLSRRARAEHGDPAK